MGKFLDLSGMKFGRLTVLKGKGQISTVSLCGSVSAIAGMGI